ncbi:cytochrome P450 [Cyathus striatus]|nr:cytochrome P450 [Cyathus striatus]
MAFETSATAILSPLLILLLIKIVYSSFRASKVPYPPRPEPLPLVGNLFNVTGDVKLDCERFQKWCKELDTDILYLNVLGTSIIYLNTYEVCNELLEKRSSIYSGRARMPMVTELMGWDFNFAFMDYGDKWRHYRKLMHQHFSAVAVKDFRPHDIRAVRGLIKRLLGGPEDIVKEMRQMAGESIMSITYGIDAQSSNVTFMELAEAAMHPLHEALSPGAFLVDTIPWLKYTPTWFPGAGFKRKAREWQNLVHRMVDIPFSETKKAINKGNANLSFVTKSLDNIVNAKGKNTAEQDVKSVAGALYQAGSETTSITLSVSILALLDHPDVVKKAQQELDSVILPGHFPDFCDADSLPYITAIVKEILRWHVISATGIPHTATSDDVYNGYHIPAGSMLIPNNHAILHDEKVFPNPELFVPERFMKNDEVVESRLQVAWGYGRRICAGRFMAFEAIWIAIASILAVYDISKPLDKNGNIIEPSYEFSNSILPVPAPFKAVFKPRNKAAEELIRSC